MNKLFYPAVFQPEDKGYSVWVPDIKGCVSQGDTIEEAYENIKEALGLFVENEKNTGVKISTASSPDKIKVESNQFVALVEFDWLEFLKKNDNSSVKKTLTIPSWLNVAAEKENINFSQLLQKALKDTLHLQ